MQNKGGDSIQPATSRYRNYVLMMLTLVYVFNFIDRQLLVILQESIKKELHLSDTLLGMLSGFTFAVFYVTLGIPIAWMADRGNRKNTITIALSLWSIMTALCGTVRNYFQLLGARIGVGVGEAGGSPPAHAMISDYFPPEKRSTALSIYSSGFYFGILIGFLSGGFLNQHLGWRVAFFVAGIPGILFAIILYITVKEPKKGGTDGQTHSEVHPPRLLEVLKKLSASKSFVYIAIGGALNVFCIYGLVNWAPSFLLRLKGMDHAQVGLVLGLIYGIAGGIGTFAGGMCTDHFGKKDNSWYLRIPAFAILLVVPCIAGALFLENRFLSLACLTLCSGLQGIYLGPCISVAHRLVPATMRAMTSAIFFLVINLVGLGLGPLIVGILSDHLKPSLGNESLRWAMAVTIPISLVSVFILLVASRKVKADLP